MIQTKRTLFTLSVFILSLQLAGCTEKRPQAIAQGQGIDLDTVEKWSTRLVDLETGKIIGTAPTTNAQENFTVSEKVPSLNHFSLVELKVLDPEIATLVGNPPFRAREKQPKGVYQLQIKLTPNYLKIYKVGQPKDLPFEEHFYTEEKFADGRIAIPLLGYKIKGYYNLEAALTPDDDETHRLIEVNQPKPEQASHVRVDWASREIFEPVQKIDLFPISLFFEIAQSKSGERELKPYQWYFSETVVEKSIKDSNTIVGENANRSDNSKLSPANKVVFIPRESELRVVNVARDERLTVDQIRNSADLNSEAALLLPVQWKNFRTKAEGKNLSLKGEKVEEVRWNARDFVEANFLKTESASIVNRGDRDSLRLIDVEIDSNYFSFTLMNMVGSNGRKIHYSFLRADQNRIPYTPKKSFNSDRKTFGFFSTVKPFYRNWEYYTENDLASREYTNRMNPASPEIVFHLTRESSVDADLERATTRAVEAWDRAFQTALQGTGRNIRVKFSPERVRLGDLRYNVIHLVDTLSEDGLLGFGPSIADPETGEIISASSNIYVSSFQSIAASTIRQYVINRIEGRLQAGQVMSDPVLAGGPKALSQSASFQNTQQILSQQLKVLTQLAKTPASELNSLKAPLTTEIQEDLKKKVFEEKVNGRCEYAQNISATLSDKEIYKRCPKLEEIINAQQGVDFYSRAAGAQNWEKLWAAAKEEIKSCSRRITTDKLVSTLIHEMGHNLGLRHNFFGSVDQKNFVEITTEDGKKITPQSSSIMEYTVWEQDRLTEAGKYDIAAIRFGYGDTVDLIDPVSGKEAGSLPVAPLESIEQALSAKKLSKTNLKPYLFCTDLEAYLGFDALCRPHDAGVTPAEIVDYYIDYYQRLKDLRRYRRVRPFDVALNSTFNALDMANRIFMPLREIYDQWRYHLGDYVKKSNRYLAQMSPQEYQQVLKAMSEDAQYKQIYAAYAEPAKKIYAFLKSVYLSPNQYCLIEDSTGRHALEFERLRDLLSESTRGSVQIRNCAEAQSAAELASVLGEKSPKILGELGDPYYSYRFDPATDIIESITEDVVGTQDTRLFADMVIGMRMPNVRNSISRFLPSMIDEPIYFQDMAQTFLSRTLDGVSLPQETGIKTALPLFEQEARLVETSTLIYLGALPVPNIKADGYDTQASMGRLGLFSVYRPQPTEDVSRAAAVLRLNGRAAYVAPTKGYVLAYNYINMYNKLDRDFTLKPISEGMQNLAEGFIKKLLPAKANVAAHKLKDLFKTYTTIKGGANERGQRVAGFEENTGDLYLCLVQKNKALQALEIALQALEAKLSPIKTEAEFEQALEKNTQEFIKETLKQDLLFTQEDLGSIGDLVKGCSATQNQTVAKVARYKKDLEAQQTILLNILGAASR